MKKNKEKKRKKIFLIGLSLAICSCQSIPINNDTSLKKVSRISNSYDDILDEKEFSCDKEKGNFSVKSISDLPELKEAPQEVVIDKNNAVGYFPGKKLSSVVSSYAPLPDKLESNIISIAFKDEYKVRLNKEGKDKNSSKNKKFFISKNGSNIDEVNKICDTNLIENIFDKLYGISEQNIERQEDRYRDIMVKEGVPSRLSLYTISLKTKGSDSFNNPNNINKIKDFINELRQSKYVKYVSLEQVGTTSSIPSSMTNEPILNNNSTTLITNDSISESLRYYYSRINYFKAMEYINELNSNSNPDDDLSLENDGVNKGVSVAVIDVGFDSAHPDKPNYDDFRKTYCPANLVSIVEETGQTEVQYPSCITSDQRALSYDIDTVNGNHGGKSASIISAPINSQGILGLSSYPKNNNQFFTPQIVPIRCQTQVIQEYDEDGEEIQKYSNVFSEPISRALYNIISSNELFDFSPPIRVVNISLGINKDVLDSDPSIATAIEHARYNGILVVIAAGNGNYQISDIVKSSAVVVGGLAKKTNSRWIENINKGSNYSRRIDISAPAEQIVTPSNTSGYELNSGTSEATPIVSSLATLLMGSRKEFRNNLNYTTVDKVKNLLIFSGKPFYSEKFMGTKTTESNPDINKLDLNVRGNLIDMYKALELSNKMRNNSSGIRLYNTDYYSEAKQISTNVKTSAFYKEDIFEPILGSLSDIEFKTYNKNCIYSWGYQIWNSGVVIANHLSGIAGKNKPFQSNSLLQPANNVSDSWITKNNSNMLGLSANVKFKIQGNIFEDMQ